MTSLRHVKKIGRCAFMLVRRCDDQTHHVQHRLTVGTHYRQGPGTGNADAKLHLGYHPGTQW